MEKTIFCDFCNESITEKLPGVRKRIQYKSWYCSYVCKGQHQKQVNDSKREEKFCIQCGTQISLREKSGNLPKIKNWNKRMYCSRACTNTGRALARAQGDEHFWSNVAIGDRDQCWPWRGIFFSKIMPAGAYGRYNNVAYKTRRAHRVAYIKSNGPIGDDVVVRHDCDNPACCNPNHLKIGTHQDNSNDMAERRRFRPPARDLRPGTITKLAKLEAIWGDYVNMRRLNGGKRIQNGQYEELEIKHCVSSKTIRQLINCAIIKIGKNKRRELFFNSAPAPQTERAG